MSAKMHVNEENIANGIDVSTGKSLKSSFLNSFSKLTNDKEKLRVQGGVALLKNFVESRNAENRTNELKYTLKRLIRGLGASGNNAKSGFYTALVALLTSTPEITVAEILEYVEKELHLSGKNAKSENADVCAGQILACGAMIRSGGFMKCTKDEKARILQLLLSAGKNRSYLYLASVNFILDLCKTVDERHFKRVVWPIVTPELTSTWPEHTMDSIYFLFCLRNKFPDVVDTTFIKQSIGSSEIVGEESLQPLANILINIPGISVINHPFYPIICKEISNSGLAVSFTNEIDWLMLRFNYNRHLVVTKILTNILTNLHDTTIIPDLLTKNYLQQTLHYFKTLKSSKEKEELQESIYKLFDMIIEVLKRQERNSETKIAVLKKIIFYPGIFIFEKITRSKVVQQITALLDTNGVKSLAKLYKAVIMGDNERLVKDVERPAWINSDKIYASQLLVKLLGHSSMPKEFDWKTEELTFLMDLALIKEEKHRNIGVELSASLRETFFRALDLKLPRLEDLRSILSHLVHHVDALLVQENTEAIFRKPLSSEALDMWQKTMVLINKLENKRQMSHLTSVFHTLLLHMVLQLFNNVKFASDSLEELLICYKQVRRDKKSKHDTEIKSDDPLWIEVVTDLFLNLLSHNSHLLRGLICSVFPHLCKYMNATSVHQLLAVLDPKTEDNPLSSLKESDESDSDLEQMVDEETDISEETDEGDESEFEEDETVNHNLISAVQAALGGNKGYQTDEESVDIDQISETEGKQLNEALAQAFKKFRPNLGRKSKKQRKDDEALTHFRTRVLDLIDIYLDSGPSMFLCLEILLPLLQLLEFCIRDARQKPLSDRIRSSIKKLSNTKKFESVEDVDETVLSVLLARLLDKGTKNALIIQEMGDKISECCIFVIRCKQYLMSLDEVPRKLKKRLNKVIIKIMRNSVESFFFKRDCSIPYVLFKDVFQQTWTGNISLATLLFDYIFNHEVRPFRRSQSLELLKIFYSNHRLLSSNTELFENELSIYESSFTESTVNLLQKLAENHDPSVKEKYICALFTLLSTMKQSPLRHEHIDWVKIGECVREYRSRVTFSNDSKSAYNRLCKSLGVSNIVKMKKQVLKLSSTEDGDNESIVSSAKDKRHGKHIKGKMKKVEMQKLKKETQVLRMQSLSEGLSSSFPFSNTNISDIKNEESDSSKEELKPKKNKKQQKEKYRNKHSQINEQWNEINENGEDITENLSEGRMGEDNDTNESNQKVTRTKSKSLTTLQKFNGTEPLSKKRKILDINEGEQRKKSKTKYS